MEPRAQSDGNTETNEESPMELESYNIKPEDTNGLEAESDQCSQVEAQSKPIRFQFSTPDETAFACNICTEKFSTGASFGKHLLQHFKCKQCSKIFTNIEQMKAHEQYHENSGIKVIHITHAY